MPKYKLDFWFEWGCETPFWAADDYTMEELGIPVKLDTLELTDFYKEELKELCDLHNSSIDWDNPSTPSPWTDNQKISFNNKALSIFHEVCKNLGSDYILNYKHDDFKDENLPIIERLISHEDRDYYTHMLEIIKVLNLPDDYICVTTDVVHNLLNYDYAQIFNDEYHFFTIGELKKILIDEDFQWVWGTLSIYEPKYTKEEILKYELPNVYEDCNPDLFLEYPILQHPLSFIEIVAFDSSYVIFTTKVHGYLEMFRKLFPKSVENF